jgi:hypothetical protein
LLKDLSFKYLQRTLARTVFTGKLRSQAAEDYLRRGLLQSSTSCAKTYSMNILTRRRLELMKTSLRVALKTEPRTILMIS